LVIRAGAYGPSEQSCCIARVSVSAWRRESIYLPGGTKIVSLLFTAKERGLPSGLFDFGTRTGLVLEGILVPWLLVHFGWRRTFLLLGFTALFWIAPWFSVFPWHLQGAERNLGSSDVRWYALARTLLNRNLLGICLGFFCFDYYWYVLVTWLPDYLVTVRQLSLVQAGFYASLAFFTFGNVPVAGLYSSALFTAPFPLEPPAASTCLFGSSAMMKSSRPVVVLPVKLHVPVEGL
jgi:ACS family D-galactonate transporter-like MFS transporter